MSYKSPDDISIFNTIKTDDLLVTGNVAFQSRVSYEGDLVIPGSLTVSTVNIPGGTLATSIDISNTRNYVDDQITHAFTTELSNNTFLSSTLENGVRSIIDNSYSVTSIIQEVLFDVSGVESRIDVNDANISNLDASVNTAYDRIHTLDVSALDLYNIKFNKSGGSIGGNTSISGNLYVVNKLAIGSTDLNATLDISGDSKFRGDVNVAEGNDLIVTGNAIVNETLRVDGSMNVDGSLNVNNDVSLSGVLYIGGENIVDTIQTAIDDLSGSVATDIQNLNSTITGTINTQIQDLSNVKFDKEGGDISGDVTITDQHNLTVTGNVIVEQDLDVSGSVTFRDGLDMSFNQIINVSDPINAQDATTKDYVDVSLGLLDISLKQYTDASIVTLTGIVDVSLDALETSLKQYTDASIVTLTGIVDASLDSLETLLKQYTDASIVTLTGIVDASLDTLETSLKEYTDASIVTLTGIVDASLDALETSLKEYTDASIVTLTGIVDVSLDALETSLKQYTDASIVTLTGIVDVSLDALETSLKSYTDGSINTLTGIVDASLDALDASLKTYTDASIVTLIGIVDASLDALETSLKSYTDASIVTLTGIVDVSLLSLETSLQQYTDASIVTLTGIVDVSLDALDASLKQYTDGSINTLTGIVDVSLDALETSLKSYTDGSINTLTGIVDASLDVLDASLKQYTDNSINTLKGYVDTEIYNNAGISQTDADSRYVNVDGDTMTGDLNLYDTNILFHSSGPPDTDTNHTWTLSEADNLFYVAYDGTDSGTTNEFNAFIIDGPNKRVGIETSPVEKLDVNGNVKIRGQYVKYGTHIESYTTTNRAGLIFWDPSDNNTKDASRFHIDVSNSGISVGIGKAPDTNYMLDVNGDTLIRNTLYVGTNSSSSDITSQIIMGGGSHDDNGYYYTGLLSRSYDTDKSELFIFKGNDQGNTSGPDRIRLKAANICFDTYDTPHDLLTSGVFDNTTKMIIKENGNVGIGTTDPGYTLDVDGTINATTIREGGSTLASRYVNVSGDTMSGDLILKHPTSTQEDKSYISFRRNGWNYDSVRLQHVRENDSNEARGRLDIKLGKHSGLRNVMTLTNISDTYGRVGIGTTNPGYKLHVNGTINGTTIYEGGSTLASRYANIAGNSTQSFNASTLTLTNSSSTRTISTNYSTSETQFELTDNSQTLSLSTGNTPYIGTKTNHSLRFVTNNTERMRVTNTGNVGIGTTTPGYKLDVDGDVKIRGSYFNIGDSVFVENNSSEPTSFPNTSYKRIAIGGGNSTGYIFGAFSGLGDGIYLSYNYVNYNGTNNNYIRQTGTGSGTSLIGLKYGEIQFATNTSGSNNPSTRMVITQNGNIGINTTSPGYSLDVDGTINATTIYEGDSTLASTYAAIGGSSSNTFTVANASSNSHAVNLSFADSRYVNVTGDTMSGDLILKHPTSTQEDKSYISFRRNGWNYDSVRLQHVRENDSNEARGRLDIKLGKHSGLRNVMTLTNISDTYGRVGIGTTNPGYKLDVYGPQRITTSTSISYGTAGTTGYQALQFEFASLSDPDTTSANLKWDIGAINSGATKDFFILRSGSGVGIHIDDSGTYAELNFTGQHHNYSVNEDIDADLKGFIVVSTGTYRNQMNHCNECNKYKVTINESLPIVDLSKKSNDKKVFGVISDKDDYGTSRQVRHGNVKSIFEQHTLDRPLTINSLGEGAIWVCNVNGAIENGDYITSSPIPGVGMIQNDDLLHNYTVAKSTMDCEFVGEQVPRKKLRQTPVMIEKTESKLIQQTDESGNLVTDESGNPVMVEERDSSGSIVKVTVYDESGNPIMIQDTYANGELKYDPVVDEQGNFIYDFIYDDSGNQLYTDKYESKYVEVFADKFVIYNDVEKTQEFYTYEFDFANGSQDQQECIGNTYVMAFIGCTYHCG